MPSSRAGCTATTPAAATTVTSCGAAPLTLCSTPTDDRGPKGFTATSTRDQERLGARCDQVLVLGVALEEGPDERAAGDDVHAPSPHVVERLLHQAPAH